MEQSEKWLRQGIKGRSGTDMLSFLQRTVAPARSPRIPAHIEDWSCIAAGAFSDLFVIDSIFGADLSLTAGLRVVSRVAQFDADARLKGLNY